MDKTVSESWAIRELRVLEGLGSPCNDGGGFGGVQPEDSTELAAWSNRAELRIGRRAAARDAGFPSGLPLALR
jgi:hypothetical protein